VSREGVGIVHDRAPRVTSPAPDRPMGRCAPIAGADGDLVKVEVLIDVSSVVWHSSLWVLRGRYGCRWLPVVVELMWEWGYASLVWALAKTDWIYAPRVWPSARASIILCMWWSHSGP